MSFYFFGKCAVDKDLRLFQGQSASNWKVKIYSGKEAKPGELLKLKKTKHALNAA